MGYSVILQIEKIDNIHFLVIHPQEDCKIESIRIPIPEAVAIIVHENLQLAIIDINELKMLYEKFKKDHPEV